jgi:hypothetical protein
MPTILYIVIAVIVGWFIGFLDSNMRTAKKIKAAESNAEIKIKEAERKIAEAEQQISLEARLSPRAQDDPGLLRLKKNINRFTVEMDGVLIPDILSPDRKKRLAELISIFRPWLEGGQTQQAVFQPAAPDPIQEAVSRPVQPVAPATKKPEEKNISTLSIVGQIDAVLQIRLMDTPFAKSGIRLQESIQGGVEVYVGLQKFDSIDEVPDEAIKSEIRAAIKEWEEKFTPGI